MKNRIVIFLCIALSLGIFSNISAQNQTKYFRELYIENKRSELKGRLLVDKSLAKYINCYKVKYDNIGRMISIEYLVRGKLSDNSVLKSSQIRFEYKQNTEKRRFLDKLGNPMMNRDGVYCTLFTKNNKNWPLYFVNLNRNDSLMLDKNSVAQYKFELDKNGYIVRETYLNRNLDRISDSHGFYYITYKRKADDIANYLELSFYDKNDKLIEGKGGFAISYSKYDKLTNKFLEGKYYGSDRKIKKAKDSGALVRYKYNKIGCCIEQAYFGIDGKLTNTTDSVSIVQQKFDKLGRIIEFRFYGTDQKLLEVKSYGYAMAGYQYDSSGNVSKLSYYNKDGHLKNSKKETAIYIYKYDTKNRKTDETRYDWNNKLIESDSGCKTKWKYDDDDNIIEESHWGPDNELKEDKNKYAIIRWEYDSKGDITKTKHYDSHENLLSEH
jgi:hypothetical protein